MPEQPAEETAQTWHRRFAVEANNRAWALSEKTELATKERTELLYAAYAAAHHWSKIGTEQQPPSRVLMDAFRVLGQEIWR